MKIWRQRDIKQLARKIEGGREHCRRKALPLGMRAGRWVPAIPDAVGAAHEGRWRSDQAYPAYHMNSGRHWRQLQTSVAMGEANWTVASRTPRIATGRQ